jgi:hypothetical protein
MGVQRRVPQSRTQNDLLSLKLPAVRATSQVLVHAKTLADV